MDGEKSVLNGTLTDLGLGQFTRRTNEIVKRINEQTLDYYEVVTALQLIIEDKHQEKLVKQLKETKEYDAKIAHIALSRIDIDLDDGVKVNYEKVQTGQDGKKIEILGKI